LGAAAIATVAYYNKENDPEDRSSHVPHGTNDPNLPIEYAQTTYAPEVPPPITRHHPARVVVNIKSNVQHLPVDEINTYEFWTFDGHVPGPFIRARVGDVLEIHLKNEDESGMLHNIDLHCVIGPGGGAPILTAETGTTKRGCFKLLYPGLFIYHCAVDPIPVHVGNGMYGMILVEPTNGLPPVDKEFYVQQSEVYATEDPDNPKSKELVLSYDDLLNEKPRFVMFNGKANRHVDEPLTASTKDRIRIFFGNAGPNLSSSFHVIGTVLDKVYREGDLISTPSNGVHVTGVPAGGTSCVEFVVPVPGTYTILDHALSRIEKGCVAFINVTGDQQPGIYHSDEPPVPCPKCKIHP